MLEQLEYINHMNETLGFGKGKLFVNENDLRDFKWEVISKNNKISGFKKGIVSKSIPLILKVDTEEEGLQLRNKLFEVFEKDVLAANHGKIIIGDYYFKCFVTESRKSNYLIHNGYMKLTVKVSSDFPHWVKEEKFSFNKPESVVAGEFLDFNNDFDYDYLSKFVIGNNLENQNFIESKFRIIIHGACTNPMIHIGGHLYQVYCAVPEGSYLTIDSSTKKIFLTDPEGKVTNCFNERNRNSYIFKPIPKGLNSVSWNGSFSFEVILLDERGEPVWI